MVDVYHALIGSLFNKGSCASCINRKRMSTIVGVQHALIGFFFFTKNNVHHAFKKKKRSMSTIVHVHHATEIGFLQ